MASPSPILRQAFTELRADRRRLHLPKYQDPWEKTARPAQRVPAGPWHVWFLLTGRRWGKNRVQSEYGHTRAIETPGTVGFIAGRTLGDVVRNVINNPRSGLLATQKPGNPCEFKQEKGGQYVVRWKNGSLAEIHTSEEPDRARGPEYDWGLADEIATWKRVVDFAGNTTWQNLLFATSGGENPRIVAGTTPRRGNVLVKELLADAERDASDVIVTRGTMLDNRKNLAPGYVEQQLRKLEGTTLWRQEGLGELLDEIEGAIVTHAMIEDARVEKAPDLVRIVVGVDPTGGTTEAGIMACGLGSDGDGYVLKDRSAVLSPEGWGRRAVDLYYEQEADRIVAERNFGGDMVESTIRVADRNVPVKIVNASRGKHRRFEPVGALYEQGRIHHVGSYPGLEDEVTCFTRDGYGGDGSPNRADAEVWAFHELMVKQFVEWGVR